MDLNLAIRLQFLIDSDSDWAHSLQEFEELISQNPKSLNLKLPLLGMNLLHYCVGSEIENFVKVLLRRGADPNCNDSNDGVSPLHLSVLYESLDMVKLLLDFGGNPYLKDKEGKTCFDLANKKNEDLIEMLNSWKMQELIENVSKITFIEETCIESPPHFNPIPQQKSHDIHHTNHGKLDTLDEETEESFANDVPIRLIDEEQKSQIRIEDVKISSLISSKPSNTDKLDSILQENNNGPTLYQSAFSIDKMSGTGTFYTCDSEMDRRTPDLYHDSLLTSDASTATKSSKSSASCTGSVFYPSNKNMPTQEEMGKLQSVLKNRNISVPVTPTTYSSLLRTVEAGKTIEEEMPTCGFSRELTLAINNIAITQEYGEHHIELVQKLSDSTKKNQSKSFFNYLFIDPRMLKGINFSGKLLKSEIINNGEKFQRFLDAVFYIGKGSGTRPIHHLVESKAIYGKRMVTSCDDRITTILNIWKSGFGVIVLNVFPHSGDRETKINEAAMIDAIGLNELQNMIKGSYGQSLQSLQWTQKTKNEYGSFLLYKSFCLFAVGGGKPFKLEDV